ncbi:MAG: cupin domain-containing protein [Pseudomonadota bacterium]
MTIAHHPDEATLMSLSAGALPAALALAVRCHLETCACCRRKLAEMDLIGSALLDGLGASALQAPPPTAGERILPAPLWDKAQKAGTNPATATAPPLRTAAGARMPRPPAPGHAEDLAGDIDGDQPLPRALIPHVRGATMRSIRWSRLGLGVWQMRLDGFGGDLGDARLVRVAPGAVLPDHGHDGTELTMVLAGSYADAHGTYRAGDLCELDDATSHQPIADPREGCVCLLASERPAKFAGLLPRLLQPLWDSRA